MCSLWWVWKSSDTFWLPDRIRLFAQYTISLSSLCKFIWRHWTYKMTARYILSSVWNKIKHILSVIHHTICGAECWQHAAPHIVWWITEIYIYVLSYYHHQIGSMKYFPLFRFRSWNNGMRCMSFYILVMSFVKWRPFCSGLEVIMFYNGVLWCSGAVVVRTRPAMCTLWPAEPQPPLMLLLLLLQASG